MISSPEAQPLVSCIMPTFNRRWFVPKAIEYFLRQDYANRELIIVDDGSDPVKDLVPDDPRMRYLRLDRKRTIGAKRNLACGEARGEIIVHWDDDDWMAAWRLNYQVRSLLSEQADICGLDRLLFYDEQSGQSWQYVYSGAGRAWVAGGTLCYTKNFWDKNPFLDMSIGEDSRFVWASRSKRIVSLQNNTFYVALIHQGNTCPKQITNDRWTPFKNDEIKNYMGKDWEFYAHLQNNAEPYQSIQGKAKTDQGTVMKLNLGCCDRPLPGFLNVDVIPAPGVEVADLRQPWPWENDSVDHVRALDIIEHLPDKVFTMNELWRVLKPGGTAEIVVPTTDGPGAWQDPTHVSFWNRRSFLYYETGNPYRERFARHYGIQAKFRTVRERIDQTQDGPRLTMVLEAVKP